MPPPPPAVRAHGERPPSTGYFFDGDFATIAVLYKRARVIITCRGDGDNRRRVDKKKNSKKTVGRHVEGGPCLRGSVRVLFFRD